MSFYGQLLALLVVMLCVAWFLAPMIWRKLGELRLAKACRDTRSIILTFDDGPGRALTVELLDLLERHEVKATFFALGRRASENTDIVKRALAAGHEVGSHTQNHLHAWKTDPISMIADIRRGAKTISQLGGAGQMFRPTYGKLSLGALLWLAWSRMQLCWWTIDTRDSWAPKSIEAVIQEIQTSGGGVVLMHDFEQYSRVPESKRETRLKYVTDMTEAILLMARNNGFSIARFSDVVSVGVP